MGKELEKSGVGLGLKPRKFTKKQLEDRIEELVRQVSVLVLVLKIRNHEKSISCDGESERLLRQILPDWAGEVVDDGKVCCEITNHEVAMIRDFLKNK